MNEEQKRAIRNRAIQILIGVIPIILLFDDKSWLRFVALAGFLYVIYNLIWFVKHSEQILYNLFPTKTVREKKPKFKDKIWSHIAIALFFSGLILTVLEFRFIENIIEETKFWRNFGLVGFLISLLILLLLYRIRPSIFHESGRRYSVIFGFVVGITFLTISISCFINRSKSNPQIKQEAYTLDSKSTGGKRQKSHWIFINMNYSQKRFEINSGLWEQLNVGDKVMVQIQKGLLNHDFVFEISPLVEKPNSRLTKEVPDYLKKRLDSMKVSN